ncbi:hypothetical protein [Rubricoccus marinus]|uniref:Uncharacterized protein n=1 Tax=Rubricoccus marinus TaxID=716817 RepID=A0A259TWJ7_9BACT|nr:hypothetical protein [Rubricoccus marinus]OZC02152.1 hypothetical protein BSZ36_03615 [Rubricoccus marinus]
MNYRPFAIVIAALAAGGLAAILTPRFTAEGETSWLIAAAAAVVAGAVFALVTHQRVDDDG